MAIVFISALHYLGAAGYQASCMCPTAVLRSLSYGDSFEAQRVLGISGFWYLFDSVASGVAKLSGMVLRKNEKRDAINPLSCVR